jgi:CxxC-x17-CxxC domain-containing protein
MGDFKQGKRFGGGGFKRDGARPSFPKKTWNAGAGRDRGPMTMHQAVCAQCGKSCEVPFRPVQGKPVYCSACFTGKKDLGTTRGGDRSLPREGERYDALPVRISPEPQMHNKMSDEITKQLELLNTKMDQLIRIAEALQPTPKHEETLKEMVTKVSSAKEKKGVKKAKKK